MQNNNANTHLRDQKRATRPEDLHSQFTLQAYPINRCPPNFRQFYTTPSFIRLTDEVSELAQWAKKGGWMNMITGVVTSTPPPKYQDIFPLTVVPLRFELIQIPAHDRAFYLDLITRGVKSIDGISRQYGINIDTVSTTDSHINDPDSNSQRLSFSTNDPLRRLTYKDLFRFKYDINVTLVSDNIHDQCYQNEITATPPSVLSGLFYIPWLYKELDVYPTNFLKKAGLSNIILCQNNMLGKLVKQSL
jgi:hypothetical protein